LACIFCDIWRGHETAIAPLGSPGEEEYLTSAVLASLGISLDFKNIISKCGEYRYYFLDL